MTQLRREQKPRSAHVLTGLVERELLTYLMKNMLTPTEPISTKTALAGKVIIPSGREQKGRCGSGHV
jgi:hypothetical protein